MIKEDQISQVCWGWKLCFSMLLRWYLPSLILEYILSLITSIYKFVVWVLGWGTVSTECDWELWGLGNCCPIFHEDDDQIFVNGFQDKTQSWTPPIECQWQSAGLGWTWGTPAHRRSSSSTVLSKPTTSWQGFSSEGIATLPLHLPQVRWGRGVWAWIRDLSLVEMIGCVVNGQKLNIEG